MAKAGSLVPPRPPRRSRRLAAAAAAATAGLLALAAYRSGDVPGDWWQCDRQCRYAYGFLDRRVVGAEVSGWFPWSESSCNCTRDADVLGAAPWETTGHAVTTSEATFDDAKPFDGRYWCGAFDSPYVCALPAADPTGPASTHNGSEPLGDGWLPLHCGKCGACSTLADAEVLWRTRASITANVRFFIIFVCHRCFLRR